MYNVSFILKKLLISDVVFWMDLNIEVKLLFMASLLAIGNLRIPAKLFTGSGLSCSLIPVLVVQLNLTTHHFGC